MSLKGLFIKEEEEQKQPQEKKVVQASTVTHSIEEAVYLSNRVIVLQPKPCRIYKVMDIEYNEEKPRDKWVFDTPEFNEYSGELTRALEEVCV